MYYKHSRKIYAELAKKYGMSIDKMSDICRSPLEFTVHILNDVVTRNPVNVPSIRIKGFGVFYVTDGKKYFLRERANGESNKEV